MELQEEADDVRRESQTQVADSRRPIVKVMEGTPSWAVGKEFEIVFEFWKSKRLSFQELSLKLSVLTLPRRVPIDSRK